MAQKDKSTEVSTIDPNLPSYLQTGDYAPQQDNFDSSDVVIPQVKLLQATSGEVTQYEEAKTGDFWHTGMDMSLGADFEFVVISRRKKYLLVAPMDDGQGVLARAEDAKTWDRTGKWDVKVDKKTTATWEITDLDVEKSGLTNWGTYDPDDENSPPAATLFYEYLILLPDHPDLGAAVLSLARSAIRPAKKGLNDKIGMHQGAGRPMQAIKFRAKSTGEKNDAGQDFRGWQFTGAGFADEDLFKQAYELSKVLTNYAVKDEGAVDDRKKADSDDF